PAALVCRKSRRLRSLLMIASALQHARGRVMNDGLSVFICERSGRLFPALKAGQRTALLELRRAIQLRAERRPIHVRQQLWFAVERRDQLAIDSRLGCVEVDHCSDRQPFDEISLLRWAAFS